MSTRLCKIIKSLLAVSIGMVLGMMIVDIIKGDVGLSEIACEIFIIILASIGYVLVELSDMFNDLKF